jgi:hypothetical protein
MKKEQNPSSTRNQQVNAVIAAYLEAVAGVRFSAT